jgi:hypothetical protein
MSTTITITGTVTDAAGATGSFSVPVTLDSFTLAAAVTPSVAPAGTTRNLTVTPSGGTAPFTYGIPTATGITFTPVSGQPNQWTFVY